MHHRAWDDGPRGCRREDHADDGTSHEPGDRYSRATHEVVNVPGNGSALIVGIVERRDFTVAGDNLYFEAYERTTGFELWKVDDTGTVVQVADLNPGPDSSFPSGAELNGEFYFAADDGTTGRELWKADGDGGVIQVADIDPGPDGSRPSGFTVFDGALYFTADDGAAGDGLWKVDGDGTLVRIEDGDPATESLTRSQRAEFDGEVYFARDDGTSGGELWKWDGDDTLVQVADINPGADSSSPRRFIEMSGELYFYADDGTTGYEPWKVDRDGEVVQVADIFPGPGSSIPDGFITDEYRSEFFVFKDELYFPADDGETGVELWKVDRTGTAVQVADIDQPGGGGPGGDGSWPYDFTEFDGEMYFAAYDDTAGSEPWKVDREGEAVRVADINPGADSSWPLGFIEFRDELYFAADDRLWKVTRGERTSDHDGHHAGHGHGEHWDPSAHLDQMMESWDRDGAHAWAGQHWDGDLIA